MWCAAPRQGPDRRRLRRHHHQPHQPRHHRHPALGAPADGRPGRDHRRRRDGVPARVAGRRAGDPGQAGHLQGADADLDVRPPHHPGRPERRLPAPRPPAAARRGRLLQAHLLGPAHPLRAHPLGAGHLLDARLRDLQDRPRAGAHPRLPRARAPDGRHRPAGVQAAGTPGPGRHQPRADPVGPRPRVRHRRFRRQAVHAAARHPQVLRDSYCRTLGIEYMHIQDPEQRRWIQSHVEVPHQRPPARSSSPSCGG